MSSAYVIVEQWRATALESQSEKNYLTNLRRRHDVASKNMARFRNLLDGNGQSGIDNRKGDTYYLLPGPNNFFSIRVSKRPDKRVYMIKKFGRPNM